MVRDAVIKGGADQCVSRSIERVEVANVAKQGVHQGQEHREGISLHHGFTVLTILLHCKQKIGCSCCLKLGFGGSNGIESPIGGDNGDVLKVEGVVVIASSMHMFPWLKQKETVNDDAVCNGTLWLDWHCCICTQCTHRVFD